MIALTAALRLVRLPNTLTAAADVFAGAALAGVNPLSIEVIGCAVGSAMLYGGGIALNDLLDVEKDRVEAPDRVLPSGLLSKRTAALIACTLLVLGLASAWLGDISHIAVTAGLLAAIVLYDTLPDGPRLIGSTVMGACRALNLARGMTVASAASTFDWHPHGFAIAAHLFLILLVTVVSTYERSERRGPSFHLALLALPLAYLVPGSLGSWPALLAGVALGAWVTLPGYGVAPRPIAVVKRAIFTLVLFDALYAIATEQWWTAVLLAAMLPLILLLARAIGQKGS